MTTVEADISHPQFPAQGVESRIREFLEDEANVQVKLHGGGASRGGIGLHPVIDSLVAVEVLLELESVVPFELPDSLVRPGGYDSVDDVVNDMLTGIERLWSKHKRENK